MVNEDNIDFEDMNWGSFTKQKNAFNSKLTLKQFADIVLKPNSKFREKTKDRARFYLNVILKKKKKKGGRMDKNLANEFRDRSMFPDAYEDEDDDPALTTMYDMEREAMQRRADQGDLDFRRIVIDVIRDTINQIRQRNIMVERRQLTEVLEDRGLRLEVINSFLDGGANVLTTNELEQLANDLDRILNPRSEEPEEQDIEESKSDFDLDELVDDLFGADGAEEEFERITGNRRPRDDDDDDDEFGIRRRFGEGLKQVMENNMFGHNSIQLSGRPFSL